MKIINLQLHDGDNERGATSIFVMIFMVVLMVFGLAALTTSLASYKLGEKSHTWSSEYYALEAQAEAAVAKIDGILFLAEKAARGYLIEERYSEASGGLLPETDQKVIATGWMNQTSVVGQEKYLQDVLQFVFVYQAGIELQTYLDDQPQLSFQDFQTTTDRSRLLNFSVSEKKASYPKNLQVTMQILVPEYVLNVTLDQAYITGRTSTYTSHYKIIKWQEGQTPFEYADDLNFENPDFEDPNFETETSTEGDFEMELDDSSTEPQDGVFK